jgi:hypothetical protein
MGAEYQVAESKVSIWVKNYISLAKQSSNTASQEQFWLKYNTDTQ